MYPQYKKLFALMTLLLALLGVVCCINMVANSRADEEARRYHAAICDRGDPRKLSDLAGDRIAVYDEQADRYVADLLPERYLAQSSEEIGWIITISYDEEQVGRYSNGTKAYRRHVTVDLYDVHGDWISTKTLRGPEPPSNRRNGFSDWRGSYPGRSQIASTCLEMAQKHLD